MSKLDITYQNYDNVFKNSFSIFKQGINDFLEIDLPEIEGFIETEFAEIETADERLDLNFRLADGSILHLEEEADISRNDLIRFASYDLKLYKRYGDEIRTIVLCVNGFQDSLAGFDTNSLEYSTTVVDMSERDGDSKIEEISQKIEAGEEVNILELIFLPLMNSDKKMSKRVKKAIDLEQEVNLPEIMQSKVVALTLVLSNKFLSEAEIEEIWRDYSMLKVFKVAEEKGREKGRKEGLEEGREEGRKEGRKEGKQKEAYRMLKRLLLKKFKSLPQEYKQQLEEKEEEELEFIAEEVFEMEEVSDLEQYL